MCLEQARVLCTISTVDNYLSISISFVLVDRKDEHARLVCTSIYRCAMDVCCFLSCSSIWGSEISVNTTSPCEGFLVGRTGVVDGV